MASRILLPLLLASTLSAAEPEWKAGVGSVVITPKEPTWLCGYGGRTKPAEGKVHDLFAKTLAIEDKAGTRLVIVTLDLGSVSELITEAVHRKLEKKHKLPRGAPILNVSHTHCAPEVAAERLVFHALPDAEEAKLAKYIDWLIDRIVESADEAIQGLKPARLSVAKSSAAFASNRRLPTPKGYVNSQNVEGVVDHDVPVLRVADAEGKLRAVLFGYACHNTTLNFQLYCGDYAGFAHQYLEEDLPGTKALFLMGCGGDQNPYPRHGPRGLEHAKAHGRALADAALKALKAPQRELHGPLQVAYDVATLDLEPLPPRNRIEADLKDGGVLAKRKAKYLLGRLDNRERFEMKQTCPLHVARFGKDMLLVAVSGETVVDYSLNCKREFADPFIWTCGYNDDVFAYLPSMRVLKEGGYEGREGILHQLTPTPFEPNVEARVMGSIRKLAAKVGVDKRPIRIVALGDSITKGVRPGVTKEQTFEHLVELALKKDGLSIEVVNVGVGSEDTELALKRLDKAVIALNPNIVVIMYGANDSWIDKNKKEPRLTVAQYKANLKKIVGDLRRAGVEPILMTTPRLGDSHTKNGAGEHPNKSLEPYVEACRETAKELKTPLVDHFAHWAEANKKADIGAWTTDQCHPNAKGMEEMASLMLPALRKALKK